MPGTAPRNRVRRSPRRACAPKRQSIRRRVLHGQTMLELVAASTIIAVALVPALRLMRDSMKVSRDVETASVMSSLCASKLEQHLALSAANWLPQTDSGDFTAEGFPALRFQVVKSDSLAAGGILGELMSITATVWDDRDSNSLWSGDEPRVVFATKLARMASYASEANGT